MRSNCLSFWFPILRSTGVNVPRTVFFDINHYDKNCEPALRKMFDMEELSDADKKSLGGLISTVTMLAKKMGFPCFLRAGHTSYKHDWVNSCLLQNKEVIPAHIQNIAEFSIMADMMGGLPINVWAVREMLETKPLFTYFSGMPITKEMRFFFDDGKVICHHPYWPKEVFEDKKGPEWDEQYKELSVLTDQELSDLTISTEIIAKKFEGFWSLDWLQVKSGKWYAIDMALGEKSYHYPSCKNEHYDEKV